MCVGGRLGSGVNVNEICFCSSRHIYCPCAVVGGVKGGGAGEGGSLSPVLPPSDDIPVPTGPRPDSFFFPPL